MDKNALIRRIGSFKGLRVAVFGDLMIDEFTYGSVNRISPEAPVPVLDVNFTEYRLGGCGNVACNISSFGSSASLFGVAGDDSNAPVAERLLHEFKIENCVAIDKSRPTTRKNRIIAHKQQVTRLDWESRKDIPENIESAVLESAKKQMAKFDIVILSDYAKGFLTDRLCSNLIALAKSMGKPVIADPKAQFSKYRGSTVITPNIKEMQVFGRITPESAERMIPHVKKAVSDTEFERILVTMGEDGMSLFGAHDYSHIQAVKNGLDVIDITGAGDTAIAAFSLALACGASYEEAMVLANFASGVVVSKFGTATCSQKELEEIIKNAADEKNDSNH